MTSEEAKKYAWEFRFGYTHTNADNSTEERTYKMYLNPKADDWYAKCGGDDSAPDGLTFLTADGEQIFPEGEFFDHVTANRGAKHHFNESVTKAEKAGDWTEWKDEGIRFNTNEAHTLRITCIPLDSVMPDKTTTMVECLGLMHDYDRPSLRWIDGEYYLPNGFAYTRRHKHNIVALHGLGKLISEKVTEIAGHGCKVVVGCDYDGEASESYYQLNIVAPDEDALSAGCANLGISFDACIEYQWTHGEGETKTGVCADFIVSENGTCGLNW